MERIHTQDIRKSRACDIEHLVNNLSWKDRGSVFRYLTIKEAERLQTLPDNYTLVMQNEKQIVSDSQRYKAIGNGWTVDVIAHILNSINNKK